MYTMGKRSARRSKDTHGRGLFERFLFSFMGPPQLGEDKAAAGYVPDVTATLCHKCGQPWDAHERVHTGTMTYVRCPDSRG
jgi:hypothetical protein